MGEIYDSIKYEPSDWRCDLFGSGASITLLPSKGKEPNWFWRLMQYLLVGNRWYRVHK